MLEMLIQGKHARLHKETIRVFKTYEDSSYVDNEIFALKFLAKQGIMNLNPRREDAFTVSMDWIQEAQTVKLECQKDKYYLVNNLASYLKNLHYYSYKNYGLYITHEDLFLDNFLICRDPDTLYFIDWGLSRKRESVYPDMASALLGAFNDDCEYYELFLKEYFSNSSKIDLKLIEKYTSDLYEEYSLIRKNNNIETDSLNLRLEKAQKIIEYLPY